MRLYFTIREGEFLVRVTTPQRDCRLKTKIRVPDYAVNFIGMVSDDMEVIGKEAPTAFVYYQGEGKKVKEVADAVKKICDEEGDDVTTDILKETIRSIRDAEAIEAKRQADERKQQRRQEAQKKAEEEQKEQERLFLPFCEKSIAEMVKNGGYNGSAIKPNSIKNFRQAVNKLAKYEQTMDKRFRFDDINVDWLNGFSAWMSSKEGGYLADNSMGGVVKVLRRFMRASRAKGLHTNSSYELFKGSRKAGQAIYLNDSDVEKLEKILLSLEGNKKDYCELFLLGIYTGQRIGDYKDFGGCNASFSFKDGRKFVTFTQHKTGAEISIPISRKVEAILQNHGGDFPKLTCSEQRFNDNIKDICRMAGIVEVVRISEIRGGKEIFKEVEKWQAVSTHTARRSFCSRAIDNGRNLEQVMIFSGHKSESVLRNYLKGGGIDLANRLIQSDMD